MAAILLKVGEAERAPTIQSSNHKEYVALQKYIQLLDKTEKNVSRQISIEQRVLLTRFQQKLQQSRIFHARLVGDKETERNLRAKVFSFNSTCGVTEDEELAFQTTLFKRARRLPDLRREIYENRPKTAHTASTGKPTLYKQRIKSAPVAPEFPKKRSQSIVSIQLPSRHRRPYTSFGTDTDNNITNLSDEEEDTLLNMICKENTTSDNWDSGIGMVGNDLKLSKCEKRTRPKTCIPNIENVKESTSMVFVREANQNVKKRQNITSRRKQRTGTPTLTEMFQNKTAADKPTLLEHHKNLLKSSYIKNRISQFCNSVQDLKLDSTTQHMYSGAKCAVARDLTPVTDNSLKNVNDEDTDGYDDMKHKNVTFKCVESSKNHYRFVDEAWTDDTAADNM